MPTSKRKEIAALKDRLADLESLEDVRLREKYRKLKAACHSLTIRLMTYLTTPTPDALYAVHQILRDVEALTGDTQFDKATKCGP